MDLDLHPGFQKKKNHETLEKTDDIPKFTVECVDFTYDKNIFTNTVQRYLSQAFLFPNLRIFFFFFFSQNFAL